MRGLCPKKTRWAVCLAALVLGYVYPASSELTLSRTVWDFESVEQGQTKTQKIVLTNPGEQPLKIEKIELPEGCSVSPDLQNKEIKPKETLEVELTFDSKGMLGKLQQYAYISLTDQAILPITIKGEVFAKAQPRLRVSPQSWDFRTVTPGESRPQTFRCENVGTGELKIEKVQIYDSKFPVIRNITKEGQGIPPGDESGVVVLAPGEKADFVVSLKTELPGKCQTDFYIKSNSAAGTFTKVSIEGYVISKTSGVVVSPDASSVTNNTPFRVEVTRDGPPGKKETLTLEKNSAQSFPREKDVPPARPTDYTLTIKFVETPAPTPKPTEEKGPSEKPTPPAPTPEAKPPEAVTPAPETPPAKPEEAEPAEKPQKKEEKKPEEPKEEKEPSPPPEKKEPEKPPEQPSAKPGEGKPPGEETPPPGQGPSSKPETPDEKKPPEGSPGAGSAEPQKPPESEQPPQKPPDEPPPATK